MAIAVSFLILRMNSGPATDRRAGMGTTYLRRAALRAVVFLLAGELFTAAPAAFFAAGFLAVFFGATFLATLRPAFFTAFTALRAAPATFLATLRAVFLTDDLRAAFFGAAFFTAAFLAVLRAPFLAAAFFTAFLAAFLAGAFLAAFFGALRAVLRVMTEPGTGVTSEAALSLAVESTSRLPGMLS